MQTRANIICSLLAFLPAACLAAEPARLPQAAAEEHPSAKELLRRATELAAAQGEGERYWKEHTLLQIGGAQLRAGDFGAARQTIRASTYPYGRDAALIRLAEKLAAAGKRNESLDVLRELGTEHGWSQKLINDGARLHWIDYLVARKDFRQAAAEAADIEHLEKRPTGFRKLAVAYARAGDSEQAAANFERALVAAMTLSDHDRARALWETADAQLATGATEGARETTRQLVSAVHHMEPFAKVAALREAAVLQAKLKDDPAAKALFARAIDAREGVNHLNKENVLQLITLAQARVGYIQDALQTAERIAAGTSYRDQALLAVSEAELAAGDSDAAIQTALSITRYLQYRDDALHAVVDERTKKTDIKQALAAAEKVYNPSRRASALLKVATAAAKSGDKKRSLEIASRIELTSASTLLKEIGKDRNFDYRQADTWGDNYDLGDGWTGLTMRMAEQRTAEVAACAMTFAQAIDLQPKPNYRESLNGHLSDEVIFALARAHAATGRFADAIDWAEHVGTDANTQEKGGEKLNAKPDLDRTWALRRRIYALLGAAEGMLDWNESPNAGAKR